MSISASQDPGHHRRIIINTTASELLNGDDYKDSPQSGSGGLHRQSSVDEYRKKYDLEYTTEEQKGIYKVNFWAQSKALFQKNFALQTKQKGTNICQILIPLSCLIITLIFKLLAKQELNKVYTFDVGMPYFFNIPYSKLYNQSLSQNPIIMSTCLEWYLYDFKNDASQETKDYVYRINGGGSPSGLLNHILPEDPDSRKYYVCPGIEKEMPYFEQAKEKGINQQIYEGLQYINLQPFDDDVDTPGLEVIPDGAITFSEANDKNLSFKIQINDVRLPEYHRGNGVTKVYLRDSNNKTLKNTLRVTDGQLILLDLMSKAFLRQHNPKIVMVAASQYMPFTTSEETLILKIMSILGATLYPVALSVILPVFLYGLVLEKEERLRQMMKMNGMKMANYWMSNYVWNFMLFMLSSLIFAFFGIFVLRLPFFVETNPWVLLATIVGWGLSQVSLSFFFQNFLAKVRTATIIGYLLSIWTCVIAVSFNVGIYPYPNRLPWHMKLYPPFAFCRLIYSLSIRCSNYVCVRGFFEVDEEMKECLAVLYFAAVGYMVLGLYLDKVWPQEYGVTRSPFYFLKSLLPQKKKDETSSYSVMDEDSIVTEKLNSVLQMSGEDEDVENEKELVQKLQGPYSEYPLVVKNLRKVYKPIGGRPAKVAVEDLSLHIKRGEMFGLLGPNGAGKTSLISMITGLYPPEAGNAWVGGYDIVNQTEQVHSRMGVCPQFDLLWPELTVEEHLLFYARIRGISKQNEKIVVTKAMQDVRLFKFAKFATNQLSGGMKRRLSVAISFVGNPQIVLLDEPTTGLDPDNRRQLWDILVEARNDRAMVLTTHSMEEADVLCTRIGIIVSGSLKCIGPQTRLKSKYGGGYQLIIHCHKDKYLNTYDTSTTNIKGKSDYYHAKVLEYVKTVLPNAVLKSSFHGSFLFQVPMEGLEVSKVFEELESKKDELAISDWGISQCTLEDVFMEIVKFVEENNQP